ncbi:MAG: hypothetical protein Q9183_004643 [Haloplaca sp. 2 TL-2023]
MSSSTNSQPCTAHLPPCPRPLNILTISGGGLQAVSSLLILDKLLKKIPLPNAHSSKPTPCDIFDLIAGIGTGGWLALLLGRFHMDIPTALAEWYNLIERITPASIAQKIRMRMVEHSVYDTPDLVEGIDELVQFYESGEFMHIPRSELEEGGGGVRCKRVFVAAPKLDARGKQQDGYGIFRTYDIPLDPELAGKTTPDPRIYKIAHAFGVTGATRYFSSPWKEPSGTGAGEVYWDTQFPTPHNITDLALHEVWKLYGNDGPISALINISPGHPDADDCKRLASRFHWGTSTSATANSQPTSSHINGTSDPRDHDSSPSHEKYNHDARLRKNKADIQEQHIEQKLAHAYGSNPPPYFRFGPEVAAKGTVRDDTHASRAVSENVKAYLRDPRVEQKLVEAGEKLGLGMGV